MYLNLLFLHGIERHAVYKLLMMMKLILVLLTVSFLHVHADSFAQRINLKKDKASLSEILDQIRKQSGYDFFYSNQVLKDAKPVSVRLNNATLEEALAATFADQPLTYAIEANTVVVHGKAEEITSDLTSTYKASPLVLAYEEVRGRVVDTLGRPLAGASVRVLNSEGKRTTLQVLTDQQGAFQLKNVPQEAKLEVRFIGYVTRQILISAQLNDIVLHPATSVLDETIVQAYGTTSRRLNTGNIAKVSSAEIERQPVSNPLATLQGRIPGMLVTQTTGLPGGAFNIQIRGRTAIDQTLTSDEPLFVIDGVPFGPGNTNMSSNIPIANASASSILSAVKTGISPFNSINPQDIESIEVLKDADATAIYGSRGANGVILITTKQGKGDGMNLSVNSYQGVSYIGDMVEMMNTSQYVAMRKKAFENDGVAMTAANAYDILLWDTTKTYNYDKTLTGGVASTHNTQLTLSGGSKLTQFSIRGGYHWENTVMSKDHNNDRLNVSFNLTQRSPDQKFSVAFSGNYGQSSNSLIQTDLASFRRLPPHLKLIDDDGNLIWEANGYNFDNPFAVQLRKSESSNRTLYSNINPVYRIAKGLKISANLGYNWSSNEQLGNRPLTSINPRLYNSTSGKREVQKGTNASGTWSFEPQIEYDVDLFGGSFKTLLGSTMQGLKSENIRITARGFSSDEAMRTLNNAPEYFITDGSAEYRYLAFFGRANYNFQNRYLINITGRRDGSSRFGPGKQFATFGAIGAAWIFTNERFMESTSSWLSFGKMRASLGSTGNDKISDYQFLDTWSVANTYIKPEIGPTFLYPDKLFNPEYHWESTVKSELALEFGLFSDRILFSPVYYSNRSSNQLVNYKLPTTTGFSTVVANLPAIVINSGVEFTLTTNNLRGKGLTWTTDFNLTVPKNVLKDFPNIENSSYYSTYVVGQPLNLIYALHFTGVDPATGINTFKDVNGDGLFNTDDYLPTGNRDPKFYGGIQNSFSYHNFQFDFFFLFRKTRGYSYLKHFRQATGMGWVGNLPVTDIKIWEKPGDIAELSKLSTTYGAPEVNFALYSDGIYEDASYLRLNNASLSYSLPKQILDNWRIKGLRFYVLGQNLLTISPYRVGDPETQDFMSIPPLRTITAGFQLNL